MIHYITFFDSYYTHQGLTMLQSLCDHTHHTWASFPTHTIGKYNEDLTMCGVGIMPVAGLDKIQKFGVDLNQIRQQYTYKEFCWIFETVYVFSQLQQVPDDDIVVYCDADLFFFRNPEECILKTMENSAIGLTPHNFPVGEAHKEEHVGRFNFGFGAFRNCELTRNVVYEWMKTAISNCGELTAGHQRHLDSWPGVLGDRFVEFQVGHNVGPWSKHAWDFPPISYHFHEFRRGEGKNPVALNGEWWNRTNYPIPATNIETIYRPYEKALERWLIAGEL